MDKINIFEIEQKLSNTDKIIKEIENSSVLGYQNVASNYKAILASNYFLKHNENIIYLTSNLFNANIAYDTLVTLIGDENVSFYPVEEFITSELLASSNNFRLERLKTIYNIVKDKKKIIVTNTEGIVKNLQSLERFKKSIIELTQDQIIEIDDLKQELVIRGYVKKSLTEEAGTFSVRGSVVDVFPVNENMPYRIVFFDNEIESIKIFDKNTQLTIEKLSEMTIFPVYELFYEEKEIDDIIKRIGNFENEKVKKDMVYLKNHQNLDQLYIYTNFIDQNVTNISELSNSKTIFIDNYLEIQEKEKQSILEITEYLDTITLVKNDDFFKQVHEMLPLYNKKVFLDTNNTEYEEFIFEVKETLETTSCFDYNNNIKNMINDVLSNINKTYVICVHDENSLLHIEDSLKTNNINYILCKSANEIKKNKVNLVISLNARGYVSYGNNYEILTPYEYLSSKISTNTKYKKYYEKSTKIKNKDDLVHGDYVVHRDYGIGIYQGIEERTINAITNDYIVVVYENESKLLIPVENVTFLEKYVGSKDRIPKLTKLGSKEWERKKAKVKEKLV